MVVVGFVEWRARVEKGLARRRGSKRRPGAPADLVLLDSCRRAALQSSVLVQGTAHCLSLRSSKPRRGCTGSRIVQQTPLCSLRSCSGFDGPDHELHRVLVHLHSRVSRVQPVQARSALSVLVNVILVRQR